MTEIVERLVEFPPKIQMSMLANMAALVKSIPEGDREPRIVGYIFGEARGVSFRSNPNSVDGSAAIALTGVFEGAPADDSRPLLRSNVLFLPEQAQQQIAAMVLKGDDAARPTHVKKGDRADRLGVEVPIAFEIAVRAKPGVGVGYEWVTRGMIQTEKVDPLERLKRTLNLPAGASTLAAISTGKQDTPALPAPKKAAKKGRGK